MHKDTKCCLSMSQSKHFDHIPEDIYKQKIDAMMENIVKSYNNYFYELFEEHGYSRDDVKRLAHEGRISVTENISGDLKTVAVDNRPIFSVKHIFKFKEDANNEN